LTCAKRIAFGGRNTTMAALNAMTVEAPAQALESIIGVG